MQMEDGEEERAWMQRSGGGEAGAPREGQVLHCGILESLGISAACEGVFKYSKYRELSDENGRPSWESAHACLGSYRV